MRYRRGVRVCLKPFHPGDRGVLQMLPLADFVTMQKIWVAITSALLFQSLFLDKALTKMQHMRTKLSNVPHEDSLKSPLDINKYLLYIFSPSPVADLAHFYRKQNMMLTPPHQKYVLLLTNRSQSGK